MEIKLITSPREGLVVWYTDDPDKQPCPAVITACLDSSCLVTTLGSQKSIRSAKMHQLSTFECHLSNAIILSPAKRNRLSVACAAAPDYANSDAGIPTQRAHLSSAFYAKFFDEIRQKVDEAPESPSIAGKSVSPDLPAAVPSALSQVYLLDD